MQVSRLDEPGGALARTCGADCAAQHAAWRQRRSPTVCLATLIAAPSSTKNSADTRDPEMHQTKNGNQWHHGMKAHIGSDADLVLVRSVATTAANAHDVTQAHALLHGEEPDVFADSGYQGVEKREEIQTTHPKVNWYIATISGKRKAMDKSTPMGAILEQLEKAKHPHQGVAPLSGHQAAVWLHQGQVPRAGEEHGQPDDAVRLVQFANGAQTTFEYGAGMSAPANGQRAGNGVEIDLQMGPTRLIIS